MEYDELKKNETVIHTYSISAKKKNTAIFDIITATSFLLPIGGYYIVRRIGSDRIREILISLGIEGTALIVLTFVVIAIAYILVFAVLPSLYSAVGFLLGRHYARYLFTDKRLLITTDPKAKKDAEQTDESPAKTKQPTKIYEIKYKDISDFIADVSHIRIKLKPTFNATYLGFYFLSFLGIPLRIPTPEGLAPNIWSSIITHIKGGSNATVF